jgi:hypothetical protein
MKKLLISLSIVAALAAIVQATEQSGGRAIKDRPGRFLSVAVAQNEHIYAGALVCVSNILAYEARDVSGYVAVGVAVEEVDQTGDSYVSGKTVRVLRGTVLMVNGGSFTLAHIGQFAYVKDDQTVDTAAARTADIPAGVIMDVTSDGVWVEIGPLNRALAGNFDALTVTGAGAIGTDLTVTGGDVTGANGNAIDIGEAADGTITFSRDDAGTVTLTSADNNADAALTVAAGGSGALTLGDSGSTTAITSSDWAISATGVATGLGNITSDGYVDAASFKVSSVAGKSCTVTNISTLSTNILTYVGGILTTTSLNP